MCVRVCFLFYFGEPEKVESCGALIVPAISEPAAQLLRILHRQEVLQHVPRDGLVRLRYLSRAPKRRTASAPRAATAITVSGT